MVEDNKREEVFVSYLGVNNELIEGYFELVTSNGWAIKIKTKNSNILTIPYTRILRIKEKDD